MGLFTRKSDPVTERSRELQKEIAELEAQIKKLSLQPDRIAVQSLARPAAPARPTAAPLEPVFEPVDHHRICAQPAPLPPSEIYNDFGVRKYDLPALLRRIKAHVRPKPTGNPKLVTYLAAGSIQGLRSLRYEKRVARNRFLFMACVFLLIMWGVLAAFLKSH